MAVRESQQQFDPGRDHLGSIYARALLGATEKAGTTSQVLSELESVSQDVIGGIPKLAAALESPRVPLAAKLSLLERGLAGKIDLLLLNFLKVVARRGRMPALPYIQRAARRLYNEMIGRLDVYVRTAAPLDPATERLVAEQLRVSLGTEIEMHTQVEEGLIGGIVVRVGDTVFDTSVAEQLQKMKQTTRQQLAARIRDSLDRFAVDA